MSSENERSAGSIKAENEGSAGSIKAARDYLEAMIQARFSDARDTCCDACASAGVGKCNSRSNRELWFEEFVMAEARDVRVEVGRCVCTLPVTARVRNGYGTLHGGAIAMLVDVIGSIALISVMGLPGGVSTDINISYMSSAKLGELVEVDARVLKAGQSMAVIEVDFRSVPAGVLLAQGRHTKYLQVAGKRAPARSKL